MTDEHINKLVSDFPVLYKNLTKFDIGDGWFKIIYKLSKDLQKESKKGKKDLPIQIVQLSSRNNKLLVYTAAMPGYCESYCTEAETSCFKTCQLCGMHIEKGLCKKCQK